MISTEIGLPRIFCVIIPSWGLVLLEILELPSSCSKVFVPSPLSTARNLGIAADCDEVFTRTNFALNAFGKRIKIAKTKATFIMHPQMPFSAILTKSKPQIECKIEQKTIDDL